LLSAITIQGHGDAVMSDSISDWSKTPGRPPDPDLRADNARLIVVSSVRFVREGLALSLRGRKGMVVVDAVTLDPQGVARIADVAPDVVLVDLARADAATAAKLLKAACPEAKLVAFALAEIDDDVFACASAGFSGYVPRESGTDEIYQALLDAVGGRMKCSPHIAAAMFSRLSNLLREKQLPMTLSALTLREHEILTLAEEGRSNKEIARRLAISDATVKNHMHNILQKLQVSRRGQAVARLRACRA
jgi:two-component system, NarL family, nitrate/nitrite response regulator NarL